MFARPIPTCCWRWSLMRMATLAPVMDADELLRAIGRGRAVHRRPRLIAASGGAGRGDARRSARHPDPNRRRAGGTRRMRVEGEVKADAPLRGASALTAATPPSAPPPRRSSLPSAVRPSRSHRCAPASAARRRAGGRPAGAARISSARAARRSPASWSRALRSRSNGDVLHGHPAQRHLHSLSQRQSRRRLRELASELYGRTHPSRGVANGPRCGAPARASASSAAAGSDCGPQRRDAPQSRASAPPSAQRSPAPGSPRRPQPRRTAPPMRAPMARRERRDRSPGALRGPGRAPHLR